MTVPEYQVLEQVSAPSRHPLAYPACPGEVARASEEARKTMRWPMMLTAGLVLLGLTGTLAILIMIRPVAASAALLVAGVLLFVRYRGSVTRYDASMAWVYRLSILGGAGGQFLSRASEVGISQDPGLLWRLVDAFGVGGAIGFGVGLTATSGMVVLTIMLVTATYRPSAFASRSR